MKKETILFVMGALFGTLVLGYFASFSPLYATIDDFTGMSKTEWFHDTYYASASDLSADTDTPGYLKENPPTDPD